MRKLFSLKVEQSNMTGIHPGEEIVVDGSEMPEGNGQDIGVFLINGEHYLSKFTRYGNQIIMLQENGRIEVVRSVNVEVIGKVVNQSIKMDIKKAPAVTGTPNTIKAYA